MKYHKIHTGEKIKGYELLEYYASYHDISANVTRKHCYKVRCCQCGREKVIPYTAIRRKKTNAPNCLFCATERRNAITTENIRRKQCAFRFNTSTGIKHYTMQVFKQKYYYHRVAVRIDGIKYLVFSKTIREAFCIEAVSLAHQVNEVLAREGKEGFLEWYQKEIANKPLTTTTEGSTM